MTIVFENWNHLAESGCGGDNTLLRENKNLSPFQRAAIKDNINKLVDYISYFELTETLLHQFKVVAPQMYDEIDAIQDNTGQRDSFSEIRQDQRNQREFFS